MIEHVREINASAARIARKVADEFTAKNPDKPRFVAGAIGPTNKTTSLGPDVENPMFRAITFDDLKNSYFEQVEALVENGVDLLLIETMNTIREAVNAAKLATKTGRTTLVSFVCDREGRILSGESVAVAAGLLLPLGVKALGVNLRTIKLEETENNYVEYHGER